MVFTELACYKMVRERGRLWSQLDLERASRELYECSQKDKLLRQGWFVPDKEFRWLQFWNGEIDAARVLGRNWELKPTDQLEFPDRMSGTDAKLHTSNRDVISIEFTLAFEDITGGTDIQLAGHQERLRGAKLLQDGHVNSFALLKANKRSGKIEEVQRRSMRPASEIYGNWARGIECSLRKKLSRVSNSEYGSGSILCVYAYGLTGHPPF